MSRLELFKSLILSKNELLNPALFFETGIPYRESSSHCSDRFNASITNKQDRIFIIFYDEKNHTYWYIKSRNNYSDGEFKELEKGEILIEESIDLSEKALYIDSSTIFRIDADLLESLVDKNLDENNENYVLNKDQQKLILNKMNTFFSQEVPYLSIVEVYKMGDRLKAISLYLCQEKYEYWYEISQEYDEWNDILMLAKIPSWEFCIENFIKLVFRTKFQKKYFPEEWKTIFEEESGWEEHWLDQKDFDVFDGESY